MRICVKWRSWTIFVLIFTWVVHSNGWTVVFTVPRSKKPVGYSSIRELWEASGSYGDDWNFKSAFDTKNVFKSEILDDWTVKNVLAVKLSAYTDNAEEAYVIFNSIGKTKNDWFDCNNIISSSYTDIYSVQKQRCEMKDISHPHLRRTFHIGRIDGGCLYDAGWMLLKDFGASTTGSCPQWERKEAPPYFYYAKEKQHAIWTSAGTGTADAMVISLSMVHVALPSATPVVNGQTTIYCGSTGFPITNVRWEKDGKLVSNCTSGGNSASLKYSGGDRTTPSLTINNLHKSDAGVYTCILTNTIDTGQDSVTLRVIDRPEVNVDLSLTTPIVSSYTTIHCNSRDFPVTHVLWKKDGNDIQSLSYDKYCGGNKETPSLTIYYLNVSDTGEYTCILSNTAGTGEATVILTVIDIPAINVTLPSNMPTEMGKLTVSCISTEFEITYVSWKKEGKNIQMSPGKYSGGNVTTPSLTIHNLQRTDTGHYTCTLGNAAGTSEQSVMFTVIAYPLVTVSLPYTTLPAGVDVTIRCTCTKCPVTKVTWKKDGSEISVATETYTGGIDTILTITIHNLQTSDTGTYTCILTNSVGIGQDDVTLTVVDTSIFRPESSKHLKKIKFWQNSTNQEMHFKKIQEKELKKLKKSLDVGKKNVTSFKRTKISASDDRASSAATGFIGAAFLAVVLGSIVLGDIFKLVRFIKSYIVKHIVKESE